MADVPSWDRIERHPTQGYFTRRHWQSVCSSETSRTAQAKRTCRAHFAAVAEPSHVAMPVDRETGRPRGFAFVEFAERAVAEEVIRKFDSQPFQGRPLAVSEARAREDRPPTATRRRWLRTPARRRRWRIRRSTPEGGGGGFGGPRPSGGGGFGGPRPGFGGPPSGPGGRDRSANFGPPAPPKRLRGKKTSQQEHKPRGPIKEKSGGRIYAVDDLEDDANVEIDDVATKSDEALDDLKVDDSVDRVDDQDEE